MLTISNVSYAISDRFSLRNLNIEIDQGKHVAIIGESGCGKTTLLKLIYGLYDTDAGTIFWNNTPITGPKDHLVPGMSFIKYLSQDFDLMPYISVEENIKKFLSRLYPEESEQRTQELLEVVEMTAFAKAHVKTLSGGQKQRVALAQSLANEPEILLLDEPFSHIDNFRKNKLRRKLFSYLKKQHITCIVATHDSTDILSYMDQTIVIKEGKVIANDTTINLYKNPQTHYIASLFGEVNEVPAYWFDHTVTDKKMTTLIYPHQLAVVDQGICVTVINSYFRGGYYLVESTYKDTVIFFQSSRELLPDTRVQIDLKTILMNQ
ncbi:ABC transporter ATP-binding protein [uncultured Dokdonia sp.]|uniref:ABC transporter ATP-binding protein n=1 Tax=uncultured Dokdonia sp. TaxID=575653 RepID=UPI00260CC453|nr:ABC transporter ATP-binding protein [uncultured Dokdonia sp.]